MTHSNQATSNSAHTISETTLMVKQKKAEKKTELLKLDHHFPSGSWGYSLEKHVLLGIRPAMLVLLILQRQIRNGIVTIIFFFLNEGAWKIHPIKAMALDGWTTYPYPALTTPHTPGPTVRRFIEPSSHQCGDTILRGNSS